MVHPDVWRLSERRDESKAGSMVAGVQDWPRIPHQSPAACVERDLGQPTAAAASWSTHCRGPIGLMGWFQRKYATFYWYQDTFALSRWEEEHLCVVYGTTHFEKDWVSAAWSRTCFLGDASSNSGLTQRVWHEDRRSSILFPYTQSHRAALGWKELGL